MLRREDFSSYEEGYRKFKWNIPEKYNIAWDCCDQHAGNRSKIALYYEDERTEKVYTFAQMKELSNKFANTLREFGIERGDRVGVCLPQMAETAIAHLGIQKLGAIGVLLSSLFGPEALGYRLEHSEAKALIIEPENALKLKAYNGDLSSLKCTFVTGQVEEKQQVDFWKAIGQASADFNIVETHAEDPALLTYTSGTTGSPKGALQAQRYFLGHIPLVEFNFNFAPQPGDVFYSPSDWAWVGGLTDLLLAGWRFGHPVVGYRPRKFDPEKTFALMEKYRITCVQFMPTSLRMMQQTIPNPKKYKIPLRAVWSGGEVVGVETNNWVEENFGIKINEAYGQTECNLTIGNCYLVMKTKPGAIGRPIPGHVVDIIDDNGVVLPANEIGEIAVKKPDPSMFLRYWKNPEATREKYIGDWLRTQDMALKDEEGYFWFKGRKDDVIKASGYRIGPEEVEAVIKKHPSVAQVGVIGSPDKVRTVIVKAFIQLKNGYQPSEELKIEIQKAVKDKLAAYEYPREIEFIDQIPMTTTGKIMRSELRKQDYECKSSQVIR